MPLQPFGSTEDFVAAREDFVVTTEKFVPMTDESVVTTDSSVVAMESFVRSIAESVGSTDESVKMTESFYHFDRIGPASPRSCGRHLPASRVISGPVPVGDDAVVNEGERRSLQSGPMG